MEEDRVFGAIDREIDSFSINVLNYDRNNPRDGQRLPGDVLYDVEKRMADTDDRRERVRRVLGAFILSVVTGLTVATVAGSWQTIYKLLWSRL